MLYYIYVHMKNKEVIKIETEKEHDYEVMIDKIRLDMRSEEFDTEISGPTWNFLIPIFNISHLEFGILPGKEHTRNKTTGEPIRGKSGLWINGKFDTMRGWAKRNGLPIGTVKARIKRGWTKEEAVTTPLQTIGARKKDLKEYTYKGKTMILSEWSRELDIPESTLMRRLERGWSVERALRTPLIEKANS